MYLVGIDISKFKHDCFIATENGHVIKDSFSFENNEKGFSTFLKVLDSLDHSNEIRIGLEATGHYGTNLKIFLHDHNYSFIEFNPSLSARYKHVTTLRRTKTDKIDAETISKMLLTYDYKTNQSISYHISKLKSLTRLRKRLVKDLTVYKERLINILDIFFPEYTKYFTQVWGKTSLYILKNYPTSFEIAGININSISGDIYSLSKGHFSLTKLTKLINAAKLTIGRKDDSHVIELLITIDLIEKYQEQIETVEKEIKNIMSEHNYKTSSIPGVGIISAASIVSEYEDFSKFDSSSKMIAFAGLDSSIYQSGTSLTYGHMVKHGSQYLRETLMNVASFVILYNATFSKFYERKRNEGKCHRVALSHVAKKLIRIIFYLETNNVSFDSSKLI